MLLYLLIVNAGRCVIVRGLLFGSEHLSIGKEVFDSFQNLIVDGFAVVPSSNDDDVRLWRDQVRAVADSCKWMSFSVRSFSFTPHTNRSLQFVTSGDPKLDTRSFQIRNGFGYPILKAILDCCRTK
jgi:hypothetical protein